MSSEPLKFDVVKTKCPECGLILRNASLGYMHMSEQHGYSRPGRSDGDDVEFDEQGLYTPETLLERMSEIASEQWGGKQEASKHDWKTAWQKLCKELEEAKE